MESLRAPSPSTGVGWFHQPRFTHGASRGVEERLRVLVGELSGRRRRQLAKDRPVALQDLTLELKASRRPDLVDGLDPKAPSGR